MAFETLCHYTNARVGDRTMMDVLVPFIEMLARDGGEGASAAMRAAHAGLDGTNTKEAKLGRST